MTLGDGKRWSTALVLLAAVIYRISVRKRWMLIEKITDDSMQGARVMEIDWVKHESMTRLDEP